MSVGSAGAAACPPPHPGQPFLAWGDSNKYVLTTGGSFEAGAAAWTLTGGAAVVSGSASNPLDPASDSSSLYLPGGGSATSPSGSVTPGADWAPTPILNSDAPDHKGAVQYQVRLTPVGDASAFLVDDVNFDPWKVT